MRLSAARPRRRRNERSRSCRIEENYAGFSLDVSFALEEGKITGFIGRNGAGKTTTIKSLLGFVHPDAGDIRFFSMPFAEMR